jgi:hypothetical protein
MAISMAAANVGQPNMAAGRSRKSEAHFGRESVETTIPVVDLLWAARWWISGLFPAQDNTRRTSELIDIVTVPTKRRPDRHRLAGVMDK